MYNHLHRNLQPIKLDIYLHLEYLEFTTRIPIEKENVTNKKLLIFIILNPNALVYELKQ